MTTDEPTRDDRACAAKFIRGYMNFYDREGLTEWVETGRDGLVRGFAPLMLAIEFRDHRLAALAAAQTECLKVALTFDPFTKERSAANNCAARVESLTVSR